MSPFIPVCAEDPPRLEFTLPFTLCAEAADVRPIHSPAANPIVINFFIFDLPILDTGGNGIAGHSFHMWANQRAESQ
jgi:hypothetical protein